MTIGPLARNAAMTMGLLASSSKHNYPASCANRKDVNLMMKHQVDVDRVSSLKLLFALVLFTPSHEASLRVFHALDKGRLAPVSPVEPRGVANRGGGPGMFRGRVLPRPSELDAPSPGTSSGHRLIGQRKLCVFMRIFAHL
eukprot:6187519-Pleurochrysis_carterae.AAC.6